MKKKIDNINIELLVIAAQLSENDIWMQGNMEIRINGEKPYSDSDIVDVDVFLESLKSNGEYYLFSCNCGVPQCSGWIKGVHVEHQENTIVWTNLNTNKKWFIEKTKIEKDLSIFRKEVQNYKKFFFEKKVSYVGVGYNW
nr:hypothetical protein [uncultured Psychroserpens sp.]